MASDTQLLCFGKVFFLDWFNSREFRLVELLGVGKRELWLDIIAEPCLCSTLVCKICQRRIREISALLDERRIPYRIEKHPGWKKEGQEPPDRFIVIDYPSSCDTDKNGVGKFMECTIFHGWYVRPA